jgi:hypothetical protein
MSEIVSNFISATELAPYGTNIGIVKEDFDRQLLWLSVPAFPLYPPFCPR